MRSKPAAPQLDRILRAGEVSRITGLPRMTRHRAVRNGLFPAPVQIGIRAVGWRESDMAAWLADRRPNNTAINENGRRPGEAPAGIMLGASTTPT